MNSKTMWIIIILLVVAVVITAITGHQKPIVDPQPTAEIDVTPSPEPAPPPSPSPSPAVIDITEEDKTAAFNHYAQQFAASLTADDEDGQIEIQVDPTDRSFKIIYNLSDNDVTDFAIAMANNSLLTYNDMIADMIDPQIVREMKTEMYCEHLIICLKNNGQVFAAYDIIKGAECPELIENVG